MSELKVNKVSPSTGTQVELEATTILLDGTVSAGTINNAAGVAVQFNGSTKLATSSTGVTVTGTVAATNFTGNGSGLTGVVAAGVGGSSSAGALGLVSDSGNTGTDGNDIVFTTGNLERGRILRSNGNFVFDTNTLVVDANNNRVGIGTTTPTTALQVAGTVTATSVDCTGTFTAGTFSPTTVSASTVTATTGTITNVNSSGTSTLAAVNVSGIANFDSGVLYVDPSSNRVGVNNTNPNASLEVSGNAMVGDGTSRIDLSNTGGTAIIGTPGAHPLILRTNGTERVRLPADASGIQFPNVNLSTGENVLDYYQEGTYTFGNGDFGGVTTNGTYPISATDRTFQWTRIGNMVMFRGVLAITALTTAGTGQMRIRFTSGTGTAPPTVTYGFTIVRAQNFTSGVGLVHMAEWSGSQILLYRSQTTAGTNLANMAHADLLATTSFRFSGVAFI